MKKLEKLSKNRLVIVPAALPIAAEMQFDFGVINPCMIPINGSPIIELIINKYDDENTDFEIISYEDDGLWNFISHKKIDNLKLTKLDSSVSIGDTILKSKSIHNYQNVIINFADTLILDDISNQKNFITFQNSLDHLRWSRFWLNKENKIIQIYDKNDEKSEENKCFSGVFGVDDFVKFLSILRKNHQHNKSTSFYKTIEEYYNQVDTKFLEIKNWYDFGHIDSYYKIKRNFFRQRDFNSINNIKDSRAIRKESSNKEKLINEISWYVKLPKKLLGLVPQIFDHNLSPQNPSVDIEFCSLPPLNELYVFSNFDRYVWSNIFEAIKVAIEEMAQYKSFDVNKINSAISEIYIDKTIARLESLIGEKDFSGFFKNKIKINGNDCYNLEEIINILPKVVKDIGLYNANYFTITHGDLCCSNILYDRKVNQIKLIDPRGSFGDFDIYGDPLYDLAKLSHSFLGDYDFIINSMFNLNEEGGNYTLLTFTNKNSQMIKEIFKTFLSNVNNSSDDYKKIRFIESLLFLSMVPLHSDINIKKAFLIQGIRLFGDIIYERKHLY